MQANTILVGIDGSPNSELALRWAIEHGAATSAEVVALHAFYIPVLAYSASGGIPPELLDSERQAKHIFDSALENIGGADTAKISLRVAEGYPPDVLAKATDESHVSMVVIGARGHGKVEELFLGSVSHFLTHRCHKPLLIVPPKWTAGHGRVVVGFNGTPESVPALQWAADYARERTSTLEAVTVYQASPDAKPGIEAHASTLLSEALAHVGTDGITVMSGTVEGHPAEVLLDRAVGADLLVVGTRGRGRLREALTGSVTHACAEHCPIPVAIIREYPLSED